MAYENDIPRISVEELQRLLQTEAVSVLDVRRRDAWAAEVGRIPGAVWLPLEEVPVRARDLPKDRPLVLYCS